jgi:PTS system nitrogen regulatory IIA component
MRTGYQTMSQAAELLGVSEAVLARWCRQGVIPSHHHRGQVVFRREELLLWQSEHQLEDQASLASPAKGHNGTLKEALKRGGLHLIPGNLTLEQWFQAALGTLSPSLVPQIHETKIQLLEREKLASTAIGRGIALPHPRTPDQLSFSENMVVALPIQNPDLFPAPDPQPVFFAFLLLCHSTSSHLQLMGKLAQALAQEQFYQRLPHAKTVETLLEVLHE